MTMTIGFVMDPLAGIKIAKDSTFAMMLAAQARGWEVFYMTLDDLYVRDGEPWARMSRVELYDDPGKWYEIQEHSYRPLGQLAALLMRKDPPFNMEYIYATYILELAQHRGTLVINRPQALRDANEKIFTTWFPQCSPPTLISRDQNQLREFLAEQGEIVVKPPAGMGGERIFYLHADDKNLGVILETLTEHGQSYAIAQRYLPEISQGDKRILLIDGEPVPYALARVPKAGEARGNLAAGGTGIGVALTERDYWICSELAPILREKGLIFVGIDVIGDYLTEINVTSPTCIRELERQYQIPIAAKLMDWIAEQMGHGKS